MLNVNCRFGYVEIVQQLVVNIDDVDTLSFHWTVRKHRSSSGSSVTSMAVTIIMSLQKKQLRTKLTEMHCRFRFAEAMPDMLPGANVA